MIVNAFTCSGAYAVLIMSGLERVENRSMMLVPTMVFSRDRFSPAAPTSCRVLIGFLF